MIFSSIRQMWYTRLISLCLMVTFVMTMVVTPRASYAQGGIMGLPEPGTMVDLSSAYVPLMLTGLKVHPDNPLLMDFIVSTGNSGLKADQVKDQSDRLIKYFLACLTIPEDHQWVNLSPYEKQRIIPEDLGQTVLGQDMLAQDYILKQLTASLIYPEKNLGKNFWDKVYAKASQMYGTNQIPMNTFNKVWILPDTAKVYELRDTVLVTKCHLKVMLDEDYLALSKHNSMPATNNLASQIVREIILPAIEQEVNTGKNFSQLRQIYNSMILAVWFKKNLKQALLNQVYTDKSKVNGVNVDDPAIKEKIYKQYLQAYKKGVFNYIKEEVDQNSKEIIPRKYFSGGLAAIRAGEINPATLTEEEQALGQAGNIFDLATLTQEANKPLAVETSTKMLSFPGVTHDTIRLEEVGAWAQRAGNYSGSAIALATEHLQGIGDPLETLTRLGGILGDDQEAQSLLDVLWLTVRYGLNEAGFVHLLHNSPQIDPNWAGQGGFERLTWPQIHQMAEDAKLLTQRWQLWEERVKATEPAEIEKLNDQINRINFMLSSINALIDDVIAGKIKITEIGYSDNNEDTLEFGKVARLNLLRSEEGPNRTLCRFAVDGHTQMLTAVLDGVRLLSRKDAAGEPADEHADNILRDMLMYGHLEDAAMRVVPEAEKIAPEKTIGATTHKGITGNPDIGFALYTLGDRVFLGLTFSVRTEPTSLKTTPKTRFIEVEGSESKAATIQQKLNANMQWWGGIAQMPIGSEDDRDVLMRQVLAQVNAYGDEVDFFQGSEALLKAALQAHPPVIHQESPNDDLNFLTFVRQNGASLTNPVNNALPINQQNIISRALETWEDPLLDFNGNPLTPQAALSRMAQGETGRLYVINFRDGKREAIFVGSKDKALMVEIKTVYNRVRKAIFGTSEDIGRTDLKENKSVRTLHRPKRSGGEGDNAALSKIQGGINLNSSSLKMESEGQKVNITFNAAMIAQFRRGDFSGVRIKVLDVTPINLMPLLGLKEEETPGHLAQV